MQTTPAQSQQPSREKSAARCEVMDEMQPVRDLMHYFREYAKENPEVAALTCVGVGFILGWKMKMW